MTISRINLSFSAKTKANIAKSKIQLRALQFASSLIRFAQKNPALMGRVERVLDKISSFTNVGYEPALVTGVQAGQDLTSSLDRLSDRLSLKEREARNHILMMEAFGERVGFNSEAEWGLTQQHRLLRETARKFAETNLTQKFQEGLANENKFPKQIFEKMAKLGLLGAIIPEKFGGSNMDVRALAIIMEELAYRSPSVALSFDITGGLIPHIIMEHGTEEQKQKYLPGIVSGEIIGAFALTEPDSGTDISSMKTKAGRQGDKFIINGAKRFITNGSEADVIVLFAKLEGEEKKDKTFSTFLIDTRYLKDKGQLKVLEMNNKMGCHGTATAELFFEDAEIPESALIGEISMGRIIALGSLNLARIEIAALDLGAARRAFDISSEYQKPRMSFGGFLAGKQLTQFRFGEMIVKLEQSRQLIYRAAWLADRGKDVRQAACLAKVSATDMAAEVIHMAQRKMGGDGYMKEYQVAQFFGDIMVSFPGEGDHDILTMAAGASALGLPRTSL